MKLTHFFRISWSVQLLVGLGLFIVSFMIESTVLQAFIATPLLAVLLAAALETGKAIAIIWHRYLGLHLDDSRLYPRSTRFASAVFRLGLVGLSVLCSLLFLSDNLDRPNLSEVRQGDLVRVEQQFSQDIANLEKSLLLRGEQLTERQRVEYNDIRQVFAQRIARLETDLKAEMDNVVNGTFKGPRYEEIEAQLALAIQARDGRLEKLSEIHRQQKALLDNELSAEETAGRHRLRTELEAQREQLMARDYADDERANDTRIVAFLKVTESVFDVTVLPLQFVFAFSILLSLLMEIGILLAFETVTVAMMPAVKAQHEEALRNELLDAQLRGEMQRDTAEHEAAVTRIRRTGDRVMEKANEYMSATG